MTGRGGQKKKELMSGTMYFAPTRSARELVDLWIMENNRAPATWEQKNLARAMELWDGRFEELPAEYCCVWDSMSGYVDNPVITHFQASREARRIERAGGTV